MENAPCRGQFSGKHFEEQVTSDHSCKTSSQSVTKGLLFMGILLCRIRINKLISQLQFSASACMHAVCNPCQIIISYYTDNV